MLYRIWPLLKEVYHYEKHSTLDSDYLRQVLTLAVVVLFALNFSCNGLDKPVVFVLTGLTSLVLLMVEWLLPRAKNEKHLVMFSNTALIFIGLLLLVWNENDGFQNLWFFLMPATLFVQSGLPIGLPFCTAYGLAATCFLWLGPLVGSTLYRRDYALFYPAAYWSFCLLMITADIFYKHYRIQQEQSEKEMEREVHATICEARQLMVSSVAAISQMIDEKDRYTSEHSHRVAEYARLIGAHMGFAGKELDSLYRSALLHDIGKIAVPDAILNKPSRLTDEEFDIMKQHTVWGRKILEGLEFLPQADCGASYHHERFDGKGYPAGLKGGQLPFYLLLGGMMLLDGVNLFLSRRSASRARELGAALAFLAGSALLFQKAYVGYFSWFFLLIFSFSCTFVLGLVDGTFINLLSFLWVMACLYGGLIPDPAALYGESFVRRFPFLYICILGVAYIIMFSIQRYWVDKAKRHLLLQQRIDAEKGKLSEMSLKVITAMYSALSSKIPEIDLHCQQTAELTQEMARRMGLDEAACRDGYYAGLLHEVGTVGLPDDVVLQRNITEEQYQLYKTYVERGCRIIQELQIVDRVAETVRYHRENYDGTGYLEGLQGEAIPLLSRILAVADFTDRHRRRGETDAQIAAALRECAGHAFDPACVGAMCKMLTEQSAARPQE